jgi:hypothetical protein
MASSQQGHRLGIVTLSGYGKPLRGALCAACGRCYRNSDAPRRRPP